MSLIVECEECNHTGKLKDGSVCPGCKGKGRLDMADFFDGMYTWRWS
jgi:DnaJ-class molecular chaperone